MNDDLRRALDDASKIKILDEYRVRLAELKDRFHHSIERLPDGGDRMNSFNCFAYAVGLWETPRYVELVDRRQNSALINSTFLLARIDAGDLAEIKADAAGPSDLVMYFDGESLRHAGRIVGIEDDLIVQSKWGGNEVHKHPLWEVPFEYGDRVRFFRAPNAEKWLKYLDA